MKTSTVLLIVSMVFLFFFDLPFVSGLILGVSIFLDFQEYKEKSPQSNANVDKKQIKNK